MHSVPHKGGDKIFVIKTFFVSAEHQPIKTGDQSLINTWRQHPDSSIWIDIQHGQKNIAEVERLLGDLGCHALAIKDALRMRHPPKVEAFQEHLFLLYRGIFKKTSLLSFEHQNIGLFMGSNYLITVHPEHSMGIDAVIKDQLKPELLTTPSQLALQIMHTSSGLYLDHVLAFEDELNTLEDELYGTNGESALSKLASYKACLIRLKRIFGYHHSMSAQLRTMNSEFLRGESEQHHLIDLDDRFERLSSLTQMHYDICGDMIDSYISITSHQLNITMRVLTVITAIFVPLGFLAGVYGMNFENIPELGFKNGYFILLSTMALIATSLIAWFKYKRWF